MKTIRRSLFETNSSSSHTFSLAVSNIKKLNLSDNQTIIFDIIDLDDKIYSHEIYNSLYRKAAYLYELIILSNTQKYLDILISILDKNNIKYKFNNKNKDKLIGNYKYYYCYDDIDNSNGIGYLVNDDEYYCYEYEDFCHLFEIDFKTYNDSYQSDCKSEEERLLYIEENILNWLFNEDAYLEHIKED